MKYLLAFIGLLVIVLLLLAPSRAYPATAAAAPRAPAVFLLQGDVTQETAIAFEFFLAAATQVQAHIYVFIDSPGGDADAGLAIYKALRASKLPTTCRVIDRAASAAFMALQGCQERVAGPKARIVTHRVKAPLVFVGPPTDDQDGVPKGTVRVGGYLPPEVVLRHALELEAAAARGVALANEYDATIAARLGLTVPQYLAKLKAAGGDWQMTAAAALAAGALDRIQE